jgi:hypothetical protein
VKQNTQEMFVATSSTLNNNNNNHPSSYIVAAATTSPTINNGIDTATNNATPQTLSDIKLICSQRKKVCSYLLFLSLIIRRKKHTM